MSVSVTATAANGYVFTGWSGASTSTSSPVTITMDGNKTLTAKFHPGFTFTDSRNNQIYKAVTIGSQTWMAENLNYRIGGSGCYSNSADNCDKYGRLYKWNEAKTVCPVGWHLPTRDEWGALAIAAGGTGTYGTGGTAGKALKSTSGWYSNSGTDEFGFSALPGGNRGTDGSNFFNVGSLGYWWTATEDGIGGAYSRTMGYNYDNVPEYYDDKELGFAVRCVRD
jgi:uncharacterized protein (TIGR02145 family)/uncharacterized repeat protein (TIGR02543 family)